MWENLFNNNINEQASHIIMEANFFCPNCNQCIPNLNKTMHELRCGSTRTRPGKPVVPNSQHQPTNAVSLTQAVHKPKTSAPAVTQHVQDVKRVSSPSVPEVSLSATTSAIDCSTWPSSLPMEIYEAILLWLPYADYDMLLNTSKKKFENVKRFTRRIRLSPWVSEEFLFSEEFRQLVLSRITNPYHQLTLQFRQLPVDINQKQILESIPCSLEVSYRGNSYNSKTIFMNRQFVSLKGLQTSATGDMIISNVQSVFIELFVPKGFANIINLTLFNCTISIPILAACHTLENLSLVRCGGFQLLDGFDTLVHLKRLRLKAAWDLKDISALHKLELLQLDILSCSVEDKSPIYRVKEAVSLTADWNFDYSQFSPSLRYLAIVDGSLKSPPALFSQLHEFQFYGCRSDSLRSLEGLFHVPIVEIVQSQIEDISGLGGNRSVKIRHCTKIKNFHALRNIPSVLLEMCPGLSNGHDLENVKYLTIIACPLHDVSPLRNVHYLKLAVSVNPPAKSMKYLRNVPILELCGGYHVHGLGNNRKIVMSSGDFRDLKRSPGSFPLDKYVVIENSNKYETTLLSKDPAVELEEIVFDPADAVGVVNNRDVPQPAECSMMITPPSRFMWSPFNNRD